jgi:hypothetical protein
MHALGRGGGGGGGGLDRGGVNAVVGGGIERTKGNRSSGGSRHHTTRDWTTIPTDFHNMENTEYVF